FERSRQFLLPPPQREDIGGSSDLQGGPVAVEEKFDLLLAKPFYVEGVAGYEMPDALDSLRRADEPAGAAPHRLALFPHRMAAAGRANVGEGIGHGVGGALFRDDIKYLRDDVARALHDDGVADANVAPV